MTPKRQNDCARTAEIFNRPGAFWIHFAELAGKYRIGQTNSLAALCGFLFGTFAVLVGAGAFDLAEAFGKIGQ